MSSLVLPALLVFPAPAAAGPFEALFGYSEVPQQRDLTIFTEWSALLQRTAAPGPVAAPDDVDQCSGTEPEAAVCATSGWQKFLDGLVGLTARKQLEAVNAYANAQRYVVDAENYGREDYWASPGQFLSNGGDCEDYAVLKFFSLQQLGWPPETMRLVVVQDTDLGQVHAVLAVVNDDGVWILDNQEADIVQDNALEHYAPVYSISASDWSLHMPHS